MLVDYASAIPSFTARNSFLNYAVAPVLQPKDAGTSLTYASYYGFTVSRRTAYSSLAWEFVKGMATSETAARAYVSATNKPPALRALVGAYENNLTMRVFARQILTARSWPQVDPDQTRASFVKLIATALQDSARATDALRTAATEVTAIMERRAL
jgi:maltose-binding protein MalE